MLAGRSVMVVEDDPILRTDAVLLFEEAGLAVVEMETADDALDYLFARARDVAAVFTDVHLPGVADGFDLAEAVAAHWPHIAVLVTSGLPGSAARAGGLPASARFVEKPWRPRDVLVAVEEAITMH